MILNHINLTVTDVVETRRFLVKYFGLQPREGAPEHKGFDVLTDDHGTVITLIKNAAKQEVSYPYTFHIGFIQPSEQHVNDLNARLKADGFDVLPPERQHAWTFYVKAPGGFVVEVLA